MKTSREHFEKKLIGCTPSSKAKRQCKSSVSLGALGEWELYSPSLISRTLSGSFSIYPLLAWIHLYTNAQYGFNGGMMKFALNKEIELLLALPGNPCVNGKLSVPDHIHMVGDLISEAACLSAGHIVFDSSKKIKAIDCQSAFNTNERSLTLVVGVLFAMNMKFADEVSIGSHSYTSQDLKGIQERHSAHFGILQARNQKTDVIIRKHIRAFKELPPSNAQGFFEAMNLLDRCHLSSNFRESNSSFDQNRQSLFPSENFGEPSQANSGSIAKRRLVIEDPDEPTMSFTC